MLLLLSSVCTREGVEVVVWLGVSEGKDQRNRTETYMRRPGGALFAFVWLPGS